MGKVILLASGNGGAGKTTLAVNLGVSLAGMGKKVLVVDLNDGFRNDDICLGLENFILFDLGDVASGLCKLEKAIVEHDMIDNLSLLSCPHGKSIEGFNREHVAALYTKLKVAYDIILVDAPSNSVENLKKYSFGADEALMVVNQDFISVRNVGSVVRILSGFGLEKRSYILNKVDSESYSNENLPTFDTIARSLSARFLGAVPDDPEIHLANNTGEPVAYRTELPISKHFSDIAKRL